MIIFILLRYVHSYKLSNFILKSISLLINNEQNMFLSFWKYLVFIYINIMYSWF
ncbi:hypothetical protein HanRHA438_Chr09g0380551 [Helianthus annuus]|nr:hypothetical protein HanRHA438_Chr09g0380551 [Helianthus annuus]